MELFIPGRLLATELVKKKDYSGIGEVNPVNRVNQEGTWVTLKNEARPIFIDEIKEGYFEKVTIETTASKVEMQIKRSPTIVFEVKNGIVRCFQKSLGGNKMLIEKSIISI